MSKLLLNKIPDKLVELYEMGVNLGSVSILSRINLSINAGDIITIFGPNGAGKTTLLKSIIGTIKPTSGFIHKKPHLRIGYVPQRMHIDSTFPLKVSRFLSIPTFFPVEKKRTILSRMGACHCLDMQMSSLSTGQLQRILLAKALIDDPEILILDEASAGLDYQGKDRFYRQILDAHKIYNCAVLLVTHEPYHVMAATNRFICMNKRIYRDGSLEQVTSSAEYKALFGDRVLTVIKEHNEQSGFTAY